MSRSLDLVAADFDSLTANDFDERNEESDGREILYELCGELRQLPGTVAGAEVLFRTMERLADSELGTPGPIVHALESWRGVYETLLVESVRRQPFPLSVWMVNRILNTQPADADAWRTLLAGVIDHPSASESSKKDAARFLAMRSEDRPRK